VSGRNQAPDCRSHPGGRAQAFAHANDVLKNAVGGISDIIHIPGAGQKSTSRTSRR
jgi:hypothetical protein